MTDKQIIIDDCIHLNEWKHCDICEKLIKTKDGANGKKREHLLTVGDLKCDFYPNCYYKQLKRKEQECEELKAKFQDMKKSRDIALKEYNEEFEYKRQITVEHLEQKKELLKQLDQLKVENENWQKEYWKLEQGNDFLAEKNNKLKQTLTEIKEIAEENKETAQYKGICFSILKKISEVENGV